MIWDWGECHGAFIQRPSLVLMIWGRGERLGVGTLVHFHLPFYSLTLVILLAKRVSTHSLCTRHLCLLVWGRECGCFSAFPFTILLTLTLTIPPAQPHPRHIPTHRSSHPTSADKECGCFSVSIYYFTDIDTDYPSSTTTSSMHQSSHPTTCPFFISFVCCSSNYSCRSRGGVAGIFNAGHIEYPFCPDHILFSCDL